MTVNMLVILLWLVHADDVTASLAGVLCQGDSYMGNCSVALRSNLGGPSVNCSGQQLLSTSLIIPRGTRRLILSHNNITELPSSGFIHCDQLKYLDLSFNLIAKMAKDSLNIPQLTTLYLHDNLLNWADVGQVPVEVFHNLTTLETLSIHNNIWTASSSYSDQTLRSLIHLKCLRIDGLPGKNVDFGPGFQLMQKLEALFIYGGLRYLSNSTLRSFRNSCIVNLTIASGVLRDLEPMAFGHLRFLQTLDLSFNLNLGFINASKAWYGLQFTRIETLYLEQSAPFQSDIIVLTKQFYTYLNETQLKHLYLDGNNIITIETGFIEALPNIRSISLSFNRLAHITEVFLNIQYLEHLEYLNANFQTRRQFVPEVSNSHGNRLARQVLVDPTYDPRVETFPYIIYSIPKNLKQLRMRDSLTVDWSYFPEYRVIGPSSLEYFDFAANGVSNWIGPLEFVNGAARKLVLDLSRNHAYRISPTFFGRLESARTISNLLLSENNLGPCLEFDTEGEILKNLTELEVIDLSDNYIKRLSRDIFKHQRKIKRISLSTNALRSFNVSIESMPLLEELDLSNNLLAYLSSELMAHLDTKDRALKVDLSGNPLQCSCDSLHFLKWIKTTNVNFTHRDSYECSFHGGYRQFHDLDGLIRSLDTQCNITEIIVGVTVPLVTIAFLITLSMCAHRHRWEIRFWFMESVLRQREDTQRPSYRWDAFVSFQDGDRYFVDQQLVPNLENSGCNLKLCIHHRDFMPGQLIVNNIYEAIQQSRKTLVVLSEAFVQSHWGQFELQTAKFQSIEDQRGIVIVIILTKVPPSLMTESVARLLQNNTYIEWPSNESEAGAFWQRLRGAIRTDVARVPRCHRCAKAVFERSISGEAGENGTTIVDETSSLI